jgi:uncharacterized alkaline shock family protein YloU
MAENGTENVQTRNQKDGKISFADDVIATIAGLAASEIQGLAGMSGGIVDGIAEFLGKKNFTKGVKVEVGNEEAAIDLFVVVDYGAMIHEVCSEVQQAVKRAVETMTGLRVVEVNVYVQGVRFEKDAKEPDSQRVR